MQTRAIGILLTAHRAALTGGNILWGASKYCKLVGHRLLIFESDELGLERALAGRSELVGLIYNLSERKLHDRVAASGIPAVNFSSYIDTSDLPSVIVDNFEVGRIAAEHFLERGFRSFGFVGLAGAAFSRDRIAAFRERLASAGYSCAYIERELAQYFNASEERVLAHWLQNLPKPAGVLCCTDSIGSDVSVICLNQGIHVPENIALIAVDNTILCELSQPPLSSIRIPWEEIGYEAAALVDRMVQDNKLGGMPHRINPLGIAVRQSSNILAISDPEVVAALRYIREKTENALQVSDVLDAVEVSRRSLERRFFKSLNRSIRDEICAARIERARQLLAEGDLPIGTIAQRAGFNSVVRLSTVFREETGFSPSAYRQKFRNIGPQLPGHGV